MAFRGRVVKLRNSGYSVSAIQRRLLEENTVVSAVSIYKLLKKAEDRGSVVDRNRKSAPRILCTDQLKFMDEALANDDELTARRLRSLLEQRWPELKVLLTTIKRARKDDLGWIAHATRTRTRYSHTHTLLALATRTCKHHSHVHTRVSCTVHASVMRVRSTSLASGTLVPRTRL